MSFYLSIYLEGCLVAGPVMERIGRKKSLMLVSAGNYAVGNTVFRGLFVRQYVRPMHALVREFVGIHWPFFRGAKRKATVLLSLRFEIHSLLVFLASGAYRERREGGGDKCGEKKLFWLNP